jgi:hypothetical protein
MNQGPLPKKREEKSKDKERRMGKERERWRGNEGK